MVKKKLSDSNSIELFELIKITIDESLDLDISLNIITLYQVKS